MSERELLLVRLGRALDRVARPHRYEEELSGELQATLLRLGVPFDERTSRKQLVSLLWARKRNLSLALQPTWDGPATPPQPAA